MESGTQSSGWAVSQISWELYQAGTEVQGKGVPDSTLKFTGHDQLQVNINFVLLSLRMAQP